MARYSRVVSVLGKDMMVTTGDTMPLSASGPLRKRQVCLIFQALAPSAARYVPTILSKQL
jgi:hypothetical protein